MAKKSTIIEEYIVTINDNDSVAVDRIYKSTKAALNEIAALNGMEVQKSWNTQELGRQLLKQFCNGEKTGTLGEYTIEREANNRINVIRHYGNTKQGLREASKVIGFDYDDAWTTQQLGCKLVKFIESNP